MKRARQTSVEEDKELQAKEKHKCLTLTTNYPFLDLPHADDRLVKRLMGFDPKQWKVCKCLAILCDQGGETYCPCVRKTPTEIADLMGSFRLNLMEPCLKVYSYYSKFAVQNLNRMLLPSDSKFVAPEMKQEEKFALCTQEAACMFVYQDIISKALPSYKYIEPDIWNLIHLYFTCHRVMDVKKVEKDEKKMIF